ncbi:sulfate adenylyltransferase [Sorangium sp. So ce590]|uniref:sulfate adenylyltransferase n=1 Tax=unclassified Sorangium TaxID=2621164 RepID=UPI003F626466
MASVEGFIVWFTGLSGSGKSTLASMLAAELSQRGVHVESLDGDVVRMHLSKGLGFSREDRDTNIRRIGFVAKLVARSGGCAITAAISPYRAIRDEQRRAIGRFCEVYCECPIDVLARRDAKGLYARALAGEIKGFTGVDDPYEPPLSPEVVVHTDRESPRESLAKIIAGLEVLGYLRPRDWPAEPTRDGDTRERGAPARAGGLVPPHGGELVDRIARDEAAQQLRERAAGLPRVALDARGASDLELIGNGAYSPLKGFMTQRDYLRVVRDRRLESGAVWSIPITLAVSREAAAGLSVGAEVALASPDGRVVGVLELGDRWAPDKDLEARHVYGTTDASHPGVSYLRSSGDVYLGGEVRLVDRSVVPLFPQYPRDPAATRAAFEARGWRRVVGFQTRNPIHRAHEYLTKCALEITDGLLLHPLVGATKAGDVPADVRMRCYEVLLERYYPEDRVVLALYPAAMRYAGPREALFHAIVRKNYGCSHFIVGRDHAGVGRFYGPYDAQRAFDDFLPSELGVEPLRFEEAFWSTTVGGMATEKTAPGGPATRIALSGTQVREMLRAGNLPPPEFSRPEVARILLEAAQGQALARAG